MSKHDPVIDSLRQESLELVNATESLFGQITRPESTTAEVIEWTRELLRRYQEHRDGLREQMQSTEAALSEPSTSARGAELDSLKKELERMQVVAQLGDQVVREIGQEAQRDQSHESSRERLESGQSSYDRAVGSPTAHQQNYQTRLSELRTAWTAHFIRDPERSDRLITADNWGYAAINGRVYVWNPRGESKWRMSETKDVYRLKLGADGNVYALSHSGHLEQLDSEGRPLVGRSLQVPEKTQDFAVSPAGSIVVIAHRSRPGQLGLIDRMSSESDAQPHIDWIETSIAGHIHSLFYHPDGALSVLNESNEVITGSPDSAREGPRWHFGEVTPIDQLTSAVQGQLSGKKQTQEGDSMRPDDFYGDYATEHTVTTGGIAFPIPISAQNARRSKPFWKPSFLYRDFPGQNLPERWGNWWSAHFPFQVTRGSFTNAANDLRREVANDWREIAAYNALGWTENPLRRSKNAAKEREGIEELVARSDEKTSEALDRLERALGMKKLDGTDNPDWRTSKSYTQVRAPSGVVNSDSNAISLLREARAKLSFGTGAPDQIVARLVELLKRNVYLPLDSDFHPKTGRVPGTFALLHLIKNRYAVLTAEMAHETTVLTQLARNQQNGQEDSLINAVYDAGFQNMDRVNRFLDAFNYLNGAFTNRRGAGVRAMTGQGVLRNDWIEKYNQMIQNMKPGESITVAMTRLGGIDLDGMAIVSYVAKASPVPFNVQPVSTASMRQGHVLKIAKTGEGVVLSFGRTAGFEIAPLAAKLTTGRGAGAPHPENQFEQSLFGFIGGEAVPAIGVFERNFENAATFNIRQDDKGKVQRVINQLLGGTLSPWELLKETSDSSNLRTVSNTVRIEGDFQTLIVGGATHTVKTTPGQLNVLRLINIPGLLRFRFGTKRMTADSRTMEGGGLGKYQQLKDSDTTGTGMFIAVNELQAANHQNDAHNNQKMEVQHKWPLYIPVWIHQFAAKQAKRDGYTMNFDHQGKLRSVTTDLHTSPKSVNKLLGRILRESAKLVGQSEELRWSSERLTRWSQVDQPFNTRRIPQLRELVHEHRALIEHVKTLRTSDAALTTQMELKPDALEMVQKTLKDNPKKLQAEIRRLLKSDQNLRITHVSATKSYPYETSASAGLHFLRYFSQAANVLTRPSAKIDIKYSDQPETRSNISVDGDLLLGPVKAPPFRYIDRLFQPGQEGLREFMANPLSNARLEWLAQLRSDSHYREINDMTHFRARCEAKLPDSSDVRVALHNGNLIALKVSDDRNSFKTVALPSDISDRLVEECGVPLLSLMSARESLVLPTEYLPNPHSIDTELNPRDDYNRLDTLLAETNSRASAEYLRPDPDPGYKNRSLHINDIIEEVGRGSAPDPAQRFILSRFFPDSAGDLNKPFLKEVLDASNHFDWLKKPVQQTARRETARRLSPSPVEREPSSAMQEPPDSIELRELRAPSDVSVANGTTPSPFEQPAGLPVIFVSDQSEVPGQSEVPEDARTVEEQLQHLGYVPSSRASSQDLRSSRASSRERSSTQDEGLTAQELHSASASRIDVSGGAARI